MFGNRAMEAFAKCKRADSQSHAKQHTSLNKCASKSGDAWELQGNHRGRSDGEVPRCKGHFPCLQLLATKSALQSYARLSECPVHDNNEHARVVNTGFPTSVLEGTKHWPDSKQGPYSWLVSAKAAMVYHGYIRGILGVC